MRSFVLATAAVALAACTHETQPARHTTVIVEGKRFSVPQGAIASDHLATEREIAFFTRSGVKGCTKGGITWEMPDAQRSIGDAIAQGDATVHAKLAEAGKIGCASPQ